MHAQPNYTEKTWIKNIVCTPITLELMYNQKLFGSFWAFSLRNTLYQSDSSVLLFLKAKSVICGSPYKSFIWCVCSEQSELLESLLNFILVLIKTYWGSNFRGRRGRGHDLLPGSEQRSNLQRGVRHCNAARYGRTRPGGRPRRGRSSRSRVGGEGRASSLALNKDSSHFFVHNSPRSLFLFVLQQPCAFLLSPPPPPSFSPLSLSLDDVLSRCSMPNGLCLRAVAWNKTKRGLGRRRMLALSQLPSTLSADMVGLKKSKQRPGHLHKTQPPLSPFLSSSDTFFDWNSGKHLVKDDSWWSQYFPFVNTLCLIGLQMYTSCVKWKIDECWVLRFWMLSACIYRMSITNIS